MTKCMCLCNVETTAESMTSLDLSYEQIIFESSFYHILGFKKKRDGFIFTVLAQMSFLSAYCGNITIVLLYGNQFELSLRFRCTKSAVSGRRLS